MKTEDDTFRVLTQKPFDYVFRMLKIAERISPKMLESEDKTEKFLLKFGWTIEEMSNRMVQENENKTMV